MIICTSICTNYLPKAMALATSVKQFHPDAKIVICLTEKSIHPAAKNFTDFDHIVLGKELGFPNFEQFIYKHSIVEASTAVKAQLFRYLLNHFTTEEHFVYLDPDIILYSELTELLSLLKTESIILTPHMLKPGNIDMEISSLKHGAYNLGFIAIRRTENANRFIDWWTERLYHYCYDDIPNGIFTDQKWIDLVPGFFDTYILKHHGYNFATWSLKTRNMTQKGNKYFVDGEPLRFIHYSGFDSGTVGWAIREWLHDPQSPFPSLYAEYKECLKKYSHGLDKIPWSYNYYDSGEMINQKLRIEYQKKWLKLNLKNPFSLSNQQINNLLKNKA